ncbi:hypothetical protein F0562_015258 [Nyssa sinensis]|uniref:Retrotransposon gag domain-containing protein n=1 Tax=Nyssa sinensis TaxID=561372 RepID=A0A5J4ZJW0_9ASTE|nr:hypothetical protein F0562_015258 [Nyssa sinensis]
MTDKEVETGFGSTSLGGDGLYRIEEPAPTDPTFKQWRSSNSLVMSWLFNSMQSHISLGFLFLTTYEIWTAVAQTYSQVGNDAQIYDLRKRVHETKQKDLSVAKYYDDLNGL